MNRNFLIAIVIAAAALVAYFILSSPSPTDKQPTGTGGANGSGAAGTPTPGNSSSNPLAQLLSGVYSTPNPDPGLIAQTKPNTTNNSSNQITRNFFLANYGFVHAVEDANGIVYMTINNSTDKIDKTSPKYNDMVAAIVASGGKTTA